MDPTEAPFRIEAGTAPVETWDDPSHGQVSWRTLVSADRTPSRGIACGICDLAPGGRLRPHRHAPAEVYFGLAGAGRVTIDGQDYPLAPGVAVYVPGGAEHTTAPEEGGSLSFFWVFGESDVSAIAYFFDADHPEFIALPERSGGLPD